MSFDDKKNLDDDEIDIAYLFRMIWSFKYSLLIFIILSVPISLWVSTSIKPTFRAETVFEKPIDRSMQSNNSILSGTQGLRFMNFLSGGLSGRVSDSFFSEIRSESFLEKVVINNAELDSQMMREFCPLPSKETSKFSLTSLLISLGLSEDKDPSESQKISLLVQCVNEMLEVAYDTYKSGKSSAYRLSIESGNPDFSANLANQIVEKYFILHETKSDQNFQKVKEYLSNVITEAQVEFSDANKLMQRFILKHTLLMNIKPSAFVADSNVETISLPLPPSPFAAKLNKDVFNLGQLENAMVKLKKARLTLSNFKEADQNEIEKVVSLTDIQEVLSGTFVTSIAKIDKFSADTSIKRQRIKKMVSDELQKLNQQIESIGVSIKNREAQTMQLMTIENRFQELAIDVSKKKLMFEGLKDQLKEKILVTGLANVEQPILLTKAVPPFSRAFPNTKLIVALGVLLSMFLGITYIIIRQMFLRRVHSISQIRSLSGFSSCYEIKYKQLKQMGERPDETVISQSFFSHTQGRGKLGCIIDISKKINNNYLASAFSQTITKLWATDNSKIVCLESSRIEKPFSVSAQRNLSSDHSDLNVQGNVSKNILSFNDEGGIIGAGEINKIKNKYSEYDKIICVLGTEIGDLTKFKFIEQCDFYILIGRSFGFDEQTYKKFSNTVWEKEKKCLGFFLIC